MFFVLNTTSGRRIGSRSGLFSIAVLGLVIFMGAGIVKAQALSEDFAFVPVSGWFTQNNSSPVGTTGWFQGAPVVFPAQAGATDSYIGANFNSTTGENTISNWLVTPQRTTISAGDVITFYSRTRVPASTQFPDRLQVRLSLAGASTNVGTGSAGLGDFTTLLLDINPSYDASYPQTWTQYSITLTPAQVPTPTSGRIAFRYFVESGGPQGVNSDYIGIDTFTYTPAPVLIPGDAPVDFNGDGKTDYAVTRNTGGGPSGQVTWFYNENGTGAPTRAFAWGLATDFFTPEDFDGDDKDDIAVWRPGVATVAAFYILNSNGFTARVEPFGQTGDDPTVVDDYNGDNKADLAVYRAGASAGQQSTWFYRPVANGPTTFVPWGVGGDFPAPGDYDGNGSADFVVQRAATGGQANFWTRLSTGATSVTTFGTPTDTIVPGDYDGDGKTDIATVKGVSGALQWRWLSSSNGSVQYRTFGTSATDRPAHGDYDGDGKTDVAVWRPSATASASAFYILNSSTGAASIVAFGSNGDYPVANSNTH